uniref:Uncharacterized protein n=1 Tax=Scophthalmus maximus TaxID=52904 RepID=A0A8D3BYU3_SCOMX
SRRGCCRGRPWASVLPIRSPPLLHSSPPGPPPHPAEARRRGRSAGAVWSGGLGLSSGVCGMIVSLHYQPRTELSLNLSWEYHMTDPLPGPCHFTFTSHCSDLNKKKHGVTLLQ